MKRLDFGNLNRGFTLIELLVVVAIIGILASVVLASLNSARVKGTDAAIKSAMANSRSQAELYFYNNTTSPNSYTGVCTSSGGIGNMVLSAAKNAGLSSVGSVAFSYMDSVKGSVCHDAANTWVAITSLKNPVTASSGWCVDSNGASKESATLTISATTCP